MGSLNEAFIKAYGRETGGTSTSSPPAAPPPAPAASQTLENWYTANTWYRVETAAVAPVAPPHQPSAPVLYQPPTPGELNKLWVPPLAASENDYQLSPPVPVPPPEVVIEDDIIDSLPTSDTAQPAVASPATATTSSMAASTSLDQLFAPVQITTGWESSFTSFPVLTSEAFIAPVAEPAALVKPAPPVAPPAEPKTSSAPAPSVEATAPPAPVVETPKVAEQPVAPPEPKPVVAPPAANPSLRLDAGTAPLPKPHVDFSAQKASSATSSASATALALKAELPAKSVAPPPPAPAPAASSAPSAPMGLVQPAWEVDRFQWPDHCKQLLSTENEYLADVGVRLANAARDGLNILAVTSTRRGEGRTTLALCLARAAAQAGVKVALVDADIENPQLVNELGVEASCGWHDVVLGKQPLAESAIMSLEDKFTFFPWTDSSGLKSLNDARATRVLRQIAKAYSLVILDLGPVPGRETRLFEDGDACPVDAAILVRDVRWTSAIEAQRVAGQLTTAGVDSVGIAENFGPRAQQAAA